MHHDDPTVDSDIGVVGSGRRRRELLPVSGYVLGMAINLSAPSPGHLLPVRRSSSATGHPAGSTVVTGRTTISGIGRQGSIHHPLFKRAAIRVDRGPKLLGLHVLGSNKGGDAAAQKPPQQGHVLGDRSRRKRTSPG